MSRPTPEYQRLLRARYKRNPAHAEIQAVLNLWNLGKQSETTDGKAERKQKPGNPGKD